MAIIEVLPQDRLPSVLKLRNTPKKYNLNLVMRAKTGHKLLYFLSNGVLKLAEMSLLVFLNINFF